MRINRKRKRKKKGTFDISSEKIEMSTTISKKAMKYTAEYYQYLFLF